jgi:hypothetical protein
MYWEILRNSSRAIHKKIEWITLSVSFILCVFGVFLTCPVASEDAHLASGLAHYATGSFKYYNVNPPLVRSWATFPVTFVPLTYLTKNNPDLYAREEFPAGIFFVKHNDRKSIFAFRVARLFLLVLLFSGVVSILLLLKECYPKTAPLFLILLWLFSPYFLGHAFTIMPDLCAGIYGCVAILCFYYWLRYPFWKNAVLSGVVLGVAELCKFTLLIFYPLFIILLFVFRMPEYKTLGLTKLFDQAKQMFVIFAVSLLIINMGYFFDGTGKPLGNFRFQTAFLSGVETPKDVPSGGGNRFKDSILGYVPVPLPANYIQGIDKQRYDFERGLPSYLRGEWSDRGWWYYYLYALLIKTPLGTLGLLLLAIYCTFFIKECNISWRDEMVILLPGITLLAFVSSQTGFSVHSRYVIPALPFFFIWISKVGRAISWKRPVFSTIVTGLLLWSVGSSLWVYPHNVSYFNGLAAVLPTPRDTEYPRHPETPKGYGKRVKQLLDAGALNGPRHLLNSNIDWGQDLFYLERWCRKNPDVAEIWVAYWGNFPLELTDMPVVGMPPMNDPQPGWYAVSVNYLYDRHGQYRYFLHFEPVARAGYSIYIYHLTQEDVERYNDR